MFSPYKKLALAARLVSERLGNNPELKEIRLTGPGFRRIKTGAGFQAASEVVFRSSPINGTPVGPYYPFLDFHAPLGFGPFYFF
ncbi:hypothetical protein [Burkholderia guangdongensis]|uniref:hypothetical protein n=1 Tax=Burkholderia guangdongensis TaxID=1792500 RepID=UPI0015C6AA65|nr:hypothetical protein [Burkholderia guangdongensis]